MPFMKIPVPTSVIRIAVIVVVFGAWLTFEIHDRPRHGIDDANIFLTYAENLAAGEGITYARNAERIEGFTSTLWMLTGAAVFLVGGSERAMLILSVLLVILTQAVLLQALRIRAEANHTRAGPFLVLYGILILASPGYITWMTITLMDTALWGLVVAAMIYYLLLPPRSTKQWIVAGLLFAAAPLARPEGLLVAPALLVLLWIRTSENRPALSGMRCGIIGAAVVVVVIALTAFRIRYFGHPLPNTYYVKVSPSLAYNLQEGFAYLFRFVTSGAVTGVSVAVVMVGGAAWFGRMIDVCLSGRNAGPRWGMKAFEALSLAAVLLLLVPVYGGGDHFVMFRFYQPAYPILCLALLWPLLDGRVMCRPVIQDLRTWAGRHKSTVFLGSLAITGWLAFFSSEYSWMRVADRHPLHHEFDIADKGIDLGTELGALFYRGTEEYPSIGVIRAGGIARTYPGPIVDLMGLNNRVIAHFPGDRMGIKNHAAFEIDAFFLVEPDILIASPPIPPDRSNFDSVALKGLFNEKRFIEGWRFGILSRTDIPEFRYQGFFNKQFLDDLSGHTAFEYHDTRVWSDGWWRRIERQDISSGLDR